MEKQKYFSSGEFAKLTGVNKRTLHYYNDIGLFRPEVIKENGYHYYSDFQFAQLEFILILRKIGLPIDEIRDYMTQPSHESFSDMMFKKKKLIDDSINQLLSVQAFLDQKAEKLKMGMEAEHGSIRLCTLPERKVILSSAFSGVLGDEDFSAAAEFALRLKKLFHLYDSFGSRISMDCIRQNKFDRYDSFYSYCPALSEYYDKLLPAGTYLRAFCIGPWDRIPDVYRSILAYADTHNLVLTGYAYEEGLNEMAIRTQHDYVTMITIRCEGAPVPPEAPPTGGAGLIY